MKELKEWIEYNIFNLKKKIDYMKKNTPDHRNIKWFEGQLVSNEKTLTKINELSKNKVMDDTPFKYRIGRIVKPKEVSWLSEDKKKEYLKHRHNLDYETFIENVFMTEEFDSSEGSEFDNICKDLRCYKYFDSYKLIEIDDHEYDMCIDKFGEN